MFGKHHLVSVVFSGLLFTAALSAQTPMPADVEIRLYVEADQVPNPDNAFTYLKQETIHVAAGNQMTAKEILRVEGLPDYSYFKNVDQTVIHGETGEIAMVAQHKFLNQGRWTLFLVSQDGQITMPFPNKEPGQLSKSSRYAQVEPNFQNRVTRPTATRFPMTTGKKSKEFDMGRLFKEPYRGLAWIPGTRNLMWIGRTSIYVLNPEAGEVKRFKAGKWVTKPTYEADYLQVLGGETYGRHFYLKHRGGMYRVGWDGEIVNVVKAERGPAKMDLFQREPIVQEEGQAKNHSQVFGDGAYFQVGQMICDGDGEVLYLINPGKTKVGIAVTAKLLAATHVSSDELRVVDMVNGQVLATKIKDHDVEKVTMADDGSLIAVQYQKLFDDENYAFDVFQRRPEGLVLIKSGRSDFMPALYQNHLFFIEHQRLVVQKGNEPSHSFAAFQGSVTDWLVRVGHEVVYRSLVPIDHAAAKEDQRELEMLSGGKSVRRRGL